VGVSDYWAIHPYVNEHRTMVWVSELLTVQFCVAFANLSCATDYSMCSGKQSWQVQYTTSTCTPFCFNFPWAGLFACTSVHYFLLKYHFLLTPISFRSSCFHWKDPSKCREVEICQSVRHCSSLWSQHDISGVNMTSQHSASVSKTLQQSVAVSMTLE
jgi:hypothetical protein